MDEREERRHGHQPSEGADVRVFVHNTYLLPSAMVALTAGNKTCTNQHIRAGLIGVEAQRHDIVALQEVWGSQVDKLDAALRPTHQIAEGCESSGAWWGLGMTASVLDTLRFYYNQNGGLWFAQSKVHHRAQWVLKVREVTSLTRNCLACFGAVIHSP